MSLNATHSSCRSNPRSSCRCTSGICYPSAISSRTHIPVHPSHPAEASALSAPTSSKGSARQLPSFALENFLFPLRSAVHDLRLCKSDHYLGFFIDILLFAVPIAPSVVSLLLVRVLHAQRRCNAMQLDTSGMVRRTAPTLERNIFTQEIITLSMARAAARLRTLFSAATSAE
jgi:hypothetical protein